MAKKWQLIFLQLSNKSHWRRPILAIDILICLSWSVKWHGHFLFLIQIFLFSTNFLSEMLKLQTFRYEWYLRFRVIHEAHLQPILLLARRWHQSARCTATVRHADDCLRGSERSVHLVEVAFRQTQRLGEVVPKSIPGLRVEGQPWRGRRCGPNPHRRVEGLRWDTSRLPPTQLHLETHDHFTCTRETEHRVRAQGRRESMVCSWLCRMIRTTPSPPPSLPPPGPSTLLGSVAVIYDDEIHYCNYF